MIPMVYSQTAAQSHKVSGNGPCLKELIKNLATPNSPLTVQVTVLNDTLIKLASSLPSPLAATSGGVKGTGIRPRTQSAS
jgi:hypothetical protein